MYLFSFILLLKKLNKRRGVMVEQILKDKISEAFKDSFVGNYIFTPEELNDIYDEVGLKLRLISNEWGASLSPLDYELVFVALVNLAKEWASKDDAFFDYIYKKLLGTNTSNGKAYNQIVNAINKLSNNKIFILDSFTKKYYATICSHAFAPQTSIESFFDMCWEIYCKDLDQQYKENDPVFGMISNCLQDRFIGKYDEEETLQIGSQAYYFRAGIKGLAIDKCDLLSKLINNVMQIINSLFNSEPIILNKYLNVLVNNWWMKKELNFGIKKLSRPSNREYVIPEYSQIKPKYIMKNQLVKLFIPSIRLHNNINYAPYIEIYSNNQCISEEMGLKGSGILMATIPFEYDVSKLQINNIRIELTHCGKVIYNSNDELNREFVFFKDEKEITSQECLPGIYFLYFEDKKLLNRLPLDINKIALNTYSIDAVVGDIIQSNNKTIFFENERSEKPLYFVAKENTKMFFYFKNQDYKVIDGELSIDVNSELEINNFGIRYSDVTFKLSDFSFSKIDNKCRYLLSSLTNPGEPQIISIFRYSDNLIIDSISFIKFNDIKIEFDKNLYYDKNLLGTVNFSADKIKMSKNFNICDDEIYLNLNEGKIIISPPVFKWKIDNSEWNYQPINKIWYKNITNTSVLYIDLPDNMLCGIAINNTYLEQIGNKLEYKVGQAVYSLSSFENTNPLVIYAKVDDQLLQIVNIFIKEKFIDDPIYVFSQNHELIWLPEFYVGNENSKFRIDIIDENNIIDSVYCDCDKKRLVLNDKSDGFYKLKIYLISQGFLKYDKFLYEKNFVLGNEKALKYRNKYFVINEVMLFDSVQANRIRPLNIDSIKYLGTKDGFDYYSGNLYVITKNVDKKYLNSMKDDNNCYVNINPVRIEIKSDNACYLGYGLDIYDENFEYDNEFTLDFEGKTNIVSKLLGEKTKNIDYFLFEVKNV